MSQSVGFYRSGTEIPGKQASIKSTGSGNEYCENEKVGRRSLVQTELFQIFSSAQFELIISENTQTTRDLQLFSVCNRSYPFLIAMFANPFSLFSFLLFCS